MRGLKKRPPKTERGLCSRESTVTALCNVKGRIRQKTKAAVFMGRDSRNILAGLQAAHTARLHLVIYSWRSQHAIAALSSPVESTM